MATSTDRNVLEHTTNIPTLRPHLDKGLSYSFKIQTVKFIVLLKQQSETKICFYFNVMISLISCSVTQDRTTQSVNGHLVV